MNGFQLGLAIVLESVTVRLQKRIESRDILDTPFDMIEREIKEMRAEYEAVKEQFENMSTEEKQREIDKVLNSLEEQGIVKKDVNKGELQ